MRILLSNDDGILAPGLAALYGAVAELGEVAVVAPGSPQSAAGHSITLRQPLVVQRVHVNGIHPFWCNSVDGRPADCVRLAVRKLLPNWPDLVLTGINAGANVGINVFYSGTVAAAAEAAMLGIPAVAFSAGAATVGGTDIDYPRVARLCRWVLDGLRASGLAGGDLVNVNIPVLTGDAPRGVRVVPQSTAELEDAYHKATDAHGRESYLLSDDYSFAHHHGDTDVASLADGYVTVTPLHVDMTDAGRLAKLAAADFGDLPDPPPGESDAPAGS
jgi:5'-nucleotidase